MLKPATSKIGRTKSTERLAEAIAATGLSRQALTAGLAKDICGSATTTETYLKRRSAPKCDRSGSGWDIGRNRIDMVLGKSTELDQNDRNEGSIVRQPATDPAERPERVQRLRAAIAATELSRHDLANALAALGHGQPGNIYRMLLRWVASEPRRDRADVPPDWLFEAIKNLSPSQTIIQSASPPSHLVHSVDRSL